MRNKIKEVA
jgi:hypothetical protein